MVDLSHNFILTHKSDVIKEIPILEGILFCYYGGDLLIEQIELRWFYSVWVHFKIVFFWKNLRKIFD